MRQKAIDEARLRLEWARSAIEALERDGLGLQQFRAEWWRFLLAIAGIYSKLEQGAKASGKSVGWFGRHAHIRRKDALLSYLHHARNSEEHSIEAGAEVIGPSVEAIRGAIVRPPQTPSGRYSVTMTAGKPVKLRIRPPKSRLLPVRDDRFGDTFSPPKMHLGQPLQKTDPISVGKLALEYLSAMIAEAEKLVE